VTTDESTAFRIAQVASADDLRDIVSLFEAYAASLPVSLAYQGFDDELASLPGKYAPPRGALLLARGIDHVPLGCVGLRPLDESGTCEMKRLFVAPAARGRQLGRALAVAAIQAARERGYVRLRLDTLPSMEAAMALYEDLGFVSLAPYYEGAPAGTRFMQLDLTLT
jgi:ribosomal protein S18 acetylase RimI-like enzyme